MRKHHIILAIAVVGALAAVQLAVRAQTPRYFPTGSTLNTSAYTLRLAGNDRYATAVSNAFVSGVNDAPSGTGYPFNSAQKPKDQDTERTKAYGFTCPGAVAIAAGNAPADALAGAPVWGFSAFTAPLASGAGSSVTKTSNGVMLLTNPAPATALNLKTQTALQRIKDACGATVDAIVFGGTAAVPPGAVATIDAIMNQVFRIAGPDRFETARQIALRVYAALTNNLPDVAYHKDNTSTETLADSIILAEGFTGADALSVSTFAADQHIPILLTPSSFLPIATKNALLEMAPKNIIVLGGTGAISAAVATEAQSAAGSGATVIRIGGVNRNETSVLIAKRLANVWPENKGTNKFSNQIFGFARSEGAGSLHVGWPDALTSSWFLATAKSDGKTPKRLAPPVEQNNTAPDTVIEVGGAVSPNPSILLLVSQSQLTAPVNDYIGGLYDPATIKTPEKTDGENDGGFAYVFGGTAAVNATVETTIAEKVSGGWYVAEKRTDMTPKMTADSIFFTAANLDNYKDVTANPNTGGGVDPSSDSATGDKVCALRKAFTGSQFLALFKVDAGATPSPSPSPSGAFITSKAIDYQDKETSYPVGESRITCVLAGAGNTKVSALGISLSGHETAAKTLDWSTDALKLTTTTPATAGAPTTFTGEASVNNPVDGCGTAATYSWTGGSIQVKYKGTTYNTASYDLSLVMTRCDPTPPAGDGLDGLTFTGTLTVKNGTTTLFTANLLGEAADVNPPMKLVGTYAIGTTSPKLGMFHMVLNGVLAALSSIEDLVVDGNA